MSRRAWTTALLAFVVTTLPASPAAAIVHPTGPAAAGSWPWAVQVVLPQNNTCGGVLVGPRRVVTAGHCLDGVTADQVSVLAGTQTTYNGQKSTISVTAISRPSGYVADTGTDVAVLTLSSTPVAPAAPIEVLRASEASHLFDGVSAQLAGWGVASAGASNQPPRLQEGTVTLNTEASCYPGMLCSTSNTEPCQLDSGDPVIVQVGGSPVITDPSPANGTWRLVGMLRTARRELQPAELSRWKRPVAAAAPADNRNHFAAGRSAEHADQRHAVHRRDRQVQSGRQHVCSASLAGRL